MVKYIALIVIASIGAYTTYHLVNASYNDYITSSECVAKYIDLGVERSAIKVDGAECSL
jgi:hypothetical protein